MIAKQGIFMLYIIKSTAFNILKLIQPSPGTTVTIPIDAENTLLGLGFAPDPNNVAQNGQDLEFSFEDGGKIVLQGYYDHFTSKTLPVMVTDSGDQLPGEQFLASLREDLLTRAGPAAGSGSPSSGSGEYADDAGNLLGGVDRLGSLGTIHWNRQAEVSEEYFLPALDPGAPSIDIGVIVPDDAPPVDPEYVLGVNGLGLTFNEAGLPGESGELDGPISGPLSFAIASNDGLAFVALNGSPYAVANGTLAGFPDAGLPGATGTLNAPVITNLDEGLYLLEFTYTFEKIYPHSGERADQAEGMDGFSIAAASINGAQSGNARANINVIDAVPEPTIADTDAITSGRR